MFVCLTDQAFVWASGLYLQTSSSLEQWLRVCRRVVIDVLIVLLLLMLLRLMLLLLFLLLLVVVTNLLLTNKRTLRAICIVCAFSCALGERHSWECNLMMIKASVNVDVAIVVLFV
jgi:hypothetical protein